MIIGILPDPENHPDWPEIEAMLKPAADYGERKVLRPLEAVWVVYDGHPVGAAVASLKADGTGEVSLVGGRNAKTWLAALDGRISAAMRDEGRTRVRAYGRKGWRKMLGKLGWQFMQLEDGSTAYEKVL